MVLNPPRVLFLENRSITDLWSAAAGVLQTEFHCELLRFSLAYGGNFPGRTTLLRRPINTTTIRTPELDDLVKMLVKTDRSSYLYGKSEKAVWRIVAAVLETLQTIEFDTVIGEVTSIYERVVEFYCRAHAIPFLGPMTARIPPDRFFFIDGSLLFPLPIKSKTVTSSNSDSMETARSNAGKNDLVSSPKALRLLGSLARTFGGWASGERMHTPSPFRRAMLSFKRAQAKAVSRHWEYAEMDQVNKNSVVYCMHVQPESTLDTYSTEYCDQEETVRTLANICLKNGRDFFVRLHPRGRDELHLHLLEAGKDNIQFLAPEISMAELLAAKPVFVSVTGTVLIEAATSGAPSIALGNSYLNSFPGVTHTHLTSFSSVLSKNTFSPIASNEEQKNWFEDINQYSHTGIIAPPEWGSSLGRDNVSDLADAIRAALIWVHNKNTDKIQSNLLYRQ